MRRVLIAVVCFAFAGNCERQASGAEAFSQVGVAKVAITPKEPLWLAGYASRDKPSEGAQHDIWLKAVAFGLDRGKASAVVVTADLLGFTAPMRLQICEQAKVKYGLEKSQVMLCASHTHSAPVVGAETMYPMSDEQRKRNRAYADFVVRQAVEVIGMAIANSTAVSIFERGTECHFGFNRRNNPESQVAKLRSEGKLRGPDDPRVRILTAVNEVSGRTTLVLFTYACHNTTLGGGFFKVCGDYAGFAQEEIEKAIPGCVAMYVAGCGGDQNPGPRGKLELAQQYGKDLSQAVCQALASKGKHLMVDPTTLADNIELAFDKSPTREELEKASKNGPDYYRRWAKKWLGELEAGRPLPRTYPYPVQVWKLGDLTWVSLGGEVVVDYSLRLRRELGSDVWVTAYANDVMAYIPSLRVLKEGGYEGATSMYAWGQPAYRWADDVEERVIKAVHRLVKEVSK